MNELEFMNLLGKDHSIEQRDSLRIIFVLDISRMNPEISWKNILRGLSEIARPGM